MRYLNKDTKEPQMRSVGNIRYVQELPDLLTGADYAHASPPKKIRLRIKTTEHGIDILGDSMYPGELEALFLKLNAPEIEMVLCG